MSNLLSGYSGLSLGILRLAIADWLKHDDQAEDARAWLVSDECRNWLEMVCLSMDNDMDVLVALAYLYDKLEISASS